LQELEQEIIDESLYVVVGDMVKLAEVLETQKKVV
jgi:hypothetical protein